jgi:hypothetical protein
MAYFRCSNSSGGGGTDLIVSKVLASNQNNSTGNLTVSYTATKAVNVLAISVGSTTSAQSTGTPTYTTNLTPTYTHEYSYPYNGSTRMRSVYCKVSVYSLSVGDTLTLGYNLTTNYQSKSITLYEIPSVADYTFGNDTSRYDLNEASLTTGKNFFMYANKGVNTISGSSVSLPGWLTQHSFLAINSESDTYTAKSSQTNNGTVALIEIQKA